MAIFGLEHSKSAYGADYLFYGVVVAAMSGVLAAIGPRGDGIELAALVVFGAFLWTLIEYLMHRYVLHHMEPFRGWHDDHHKRPMALISSPTLLSAALIVVLVFLPAWMLIGIWHGTAVTLGVVAGYLAYGVAHHATHHWRAEGNWLKKRKLWHAMHHRFSEDEVCFGVTTSLWDHVFGTTVAKAKAARAAKTDTDAAPPQGQLNAR